MCSPEHYALIAKEKLARKYTLEELLAEMPKEVPLVEGGDEMRSIGRESN